jgi:hypothetical protein
MLKIHFLNVGKGSCTVIHQFPNGNLAVTDNSKLEDENDILQGPIKFL